MTQSSNSFNKTTAATTPPLGTDSKAEAAKQQAGAVADTTKVQAEQVRNTAVGQAQEVKDHAVAEAQGVKDVALEAGQQVAGAAKLEGAAVVGEAADQIRGLVDATRGEVRDRAADGHRAVASTVASLSDELTRFTRGESTQGPVAQFATQLASRGENLSTWLQNSEPEDILVEVRRFAARRPVAFLAIAAGAGVLAGRLARGTRDLADEQERRSQQLARPVVTEQAHLGVQQGHIAPQPRLHDLQPEARVQSYQQPATTTLGEPRPLVEEGHVHTTGQPLPGQMPRRTEDGLR